MGSSTEIAHQESKSEEIHVEKSGDRKDDNPLDIQPLGNSTSIDIDKDHMNYDRVDKEVAEYASGDRVTVDPETNKRLKKMIDRRVLVIMIITYFLQALDKGTISFTSIMKLPEDTGLQGQQVS
jgi:hypothetical protein